MAQGSEFRRVDTGTSYHRSLFLYEHALSSRWQVLTKYSAVSQRGVVFFRAQDSLTDDLQKELVYRLGQLTGKPESSGLHIHPVSNSGREHGGTDDEISIISSLQAKKIYKNSFYEPINKRQNGKDGWHSDITFEAVPSDYTILRLTELPSTGGGMISTSKISPLFAQLTFNVILVKLPAIANT